MDIFKLFGTIAINNDSAMKKIGETSESANALSKTFSAVGSAALKIGKVAGVGLAAAATATSMLFKKSVAGYADYEQLQGGIKKLYGESSDAMMEYAQNAYKTAGMSANQYMEQATSFASALIKSCGGDQAKAAEITDMAMRDMSDNANTYGTDMQSILNAYQGFSKQNYTMLDNLKLGYYGSRSEMQRLLRDAQKIQKQNGVNVRYNIKNLDDIYEAIHVIQEANGVAGTTAAEAAETISGSWNSAKSAFDNMIVGMADGTQDMDMLIGNFSSSAVNVVKNVAKILPNIASGFSEVIKGIAPEIPGIIESTLPSVLDGAIALIEGLVSALPGMLSSVGSAISNAWKNIVWPKIQGVFKEKFGIELPDWEDIGTEIQNGWKNTVWPMIQGFFSQWFAIELPDWETTANDISTWWDDVKAKIGGLFEDVFSVFTEDSDGKSVINRITTWWSNVTSSISKLFQAVFSVFTEDEDGNFAIVRISDWWEKVTDSIGGLFQSVFSVFTEDEDGKTAIERISEWWAKVLVGIVDLFCSMFKIELPSIQEIQKAISDWWSDVVKGISLSLGISPKLNATEQGAKNAASEMGQRIGANDGVKGSGWYSGGKGSGSSETKLTYRENAIGAVFSKPTIFDTRLGGQMVGEAGPEAVAPIDVLQGYVAQAVASQNAMLVNAIERMVEAVEKMDANMGGNMRDALEDTSLKINNREFARMVKAVG